VRSGAIVLTGVYPVCPRLKCASGSVVAKVTIERFTNTAENEPTKSFV
jgi:hypothetical protein